MGIFSEVRKRVEESFRMEETIRIKDPVHCEVSPRLAQKIKPLLSFTAYYYQQSPFGRKIKQEYQKSTMSKGNGMFYFYTGLLPRVLKFCKEQRIDISIKGSEMLFKTKEPYLEDIDLERDQLRAIVDALKKQRGILKAPTGMGKTIMGLAFLTGVDCEDFRVLWLCHTQDLMYQAYEEAIKYFNGVGLLGDGKKHLDSKFLIATRQSYVDYCGKMGHLFDAVVVDEVHHVAKLEGEYARILRNTMAPIRLGLTATTKNEGEGLLISEGLIGPIIGEITIDQGMKSGRLAKPIIRIIKAPLRKDIKHWRKYQDVYNDQVVWGRERNLAIAKTMKEHYDKGDSILTILNRVPHGNYLWQLCREVGINDAVFLQGEDKSSMRSAVKNSLNQKELRCVITTPIWVEGVNIPELNVVINAGGGKAEIRTLQIIGRGLRTTKTKKEIIIYDIEDHSNKFLTNHFMERMAVYEDQGWLE